MPVDEAFSAVARITRSVGVPVTADVEAGYGLPPAELVERLVAAGAAGCNLEDTVHPAKQLVPVDEQAARLRAVVDAARSAGVPLFVNARVDVFVRDVGVTGAERIEMALERGRAYLDAGADCVYPIGAPDVATYAAVVQGLGGVAVNALQREGLSLDGLAGTGVARITFGGGLFRLVLDGVRDLASTRADGRDPFTQAT